MKNLMTLFLLISLAHIAQANTWTEFKTQFKNSPYTKNWKISKTLEEFRNKAQKGPMARLNIPESPRPVRLAKTTIRVFKHENVKNPDGSNRVNKSVLCEKIVYSHVYDFRNSDEDSLSLFENEKVLECNDFAFNKDGEYVSWPVSVLNVLALYKTPDAEEFEDIVSKPIKSNLSFLLAGNVNQSSKGVKFPLASFVATATTDLGSQSTLQVLRPHVMEFCSTGSPDKIVKKSKFR